MEKTEVITDRSSVKLSKSSKGINISVSVSAGCSENEFERISSLAERKFNELVTKYHAMG